MNRIKNIKHKYNLDNYSLLLYILVSFSFPAVFNITNSLIIAITLFQIYRLKKNKISNSYFISTYFYLLIFSLIFFSSTHTILLIINICFHFYIFIKQKRLINKKTIALEIYVLIFFGLIAVNYLIHIPNLKGLETSLYLLLYPLLFIIIKSQPVFIEVYKTINVYITSVIVATVYLLIINLFFDKITLSTNTFFSEYLGIIHVYYGMFVGLAICFLLITYNNSNKFLNALFCIFLLIILIYIGARISLLAVICVFGIILYNKSSLKWYKKSILLLMVFVSLLTLSYNTIPRAKEGVKYIDKVYTSFKTDNKQDLIDNSWRNMYQRFLVLDYTFKEIKEHYFLGIGNKNVKNTISTKIIKDGYIYFEPINTHNQYLHFLVGMGFLPFLFFIWMLFYFFKNYSYTTYGLYFLIFFLLIMLTESILVRVKGISLFFIFYLIFSLQEKKRLHV